MTRSPSSRASTASKAGTHCETWWKKPLVTVWEPEAPADVQQVLKTAMQGREKRDYALFCSVASDQFKAFVTKERFETGSQRLSPFFQADHRVTYMGAVQRAGKPVYFWRLWVPGWDTDMLIRMTLNDAGKIAGLLYSDPFDTAINTAR